MADRIQREIEEILERLDSDAPGKAASGDARKPISIVSRRKGRVRGPRFAGRLGAVLQPTTLLVTGAIVMVVGFLVANAWEPFIWVSFGGVVLFLSAFLSTFIRRKRGTSALSQPQRGVYWRDRYISYEPPPGAGPWGRITRRFRKR